VLSGRPSSAVCVLDPWTSLAKKEGIVLVAPDATTSQGWRVPEDGPECLYDLVELIANEIDIDRRRVYIFGHSAGAGHALVMALLESEYFAAVAIHAGALPESSSPLIDRAARKTPIAIWVGTNDALFPLSVVRATRDALKAGGFRSELTEISGHTQWYYDTAGDINKRVWDFSVSSICRTSRSTSGIRTGGDDGPHLYFLARPSASGFTTWIGLPAA
jgi:hypothetical protein